VKEVAAEVERVEKSRTAASRRGSSTPQAVRKNSVDPSEIDRQNKAHRKMKNKYILYNSCETVYKHTFNGI